MVEFQIAGIRFRTADDDDDEAAATVQTRYAAYASTPSRPALRTVQLVATTATIPADAAQTGADVAFERRGNVVRVERLDFRGTVDLDAGRVEVAFAGVGGAQSFLRIACSVLLAPLGGILVHSCSVLRGDKAFLFVGESGAGKTTIARLSAPSLILSDEVSAILPSAPGSGSYACHATPFWGDLADGLDEEGRRVVLREQPAAAPLARILFPRKDTRDAVVPVSSSYAFMELAREAFAFGDDEDAATAISTTCGLVAESVPAADLHFRKTPDFWSCIAP
jgi:hypothetical protein